MKNQREKIEFENLTGPEKCAILLNNLGKEAMKQILPSMNDADVRKILTLMPKFKVVPVVVVKRVLEEFYENISETDNYLFSEKTYSKETIIEVLGEARAKGIIGGVDFKKSHGQLEALEAVDAKTLSNYLINEHPQTIALILAHLEPEKKTEVLKRLPQNLHADIVVRIATIEQVDPDLLKSLNQILKEEFANVSESSQTTLGGIHSVVELINNLDKTSATAILASIEERDPLLVEEIRKLLFTFEDIIKIDSKGIQAIVREVPADKLRIALRKTTEEVKSKFLASMSTRAGESLKEDLASAQKVRASDVELAQKEIVEIVRRLEAKGEVIISQGSLDEYV